MYYNSCKGKYGRCFNNDYIDNELIKPGVGVCTCEKKVPCKGTCRGLR